MTVLPRVAWMNNEMHGLAKQMIDHQSKQPSWFRIPGEQWICYIAGARIVKNIADMIWQHINCAAIDTHWEQKVQYKQGYKTMLDYEMAGQAIWNLPLAGQRWVAKSAARFLPYGVNMK